MKKISIIIPIYNVELYIRKCLDSVINQTYKNLEIICINDGSTDRSGNICDEYARSDSRIKVVHKENGGNPSAINLGLDSCTGEYIGFVDPDDWIELDYYKRAYDEIEKNNVDIVCFGYYKDTKYKSEKIKNRFEVKSEKLSKEEVLRYCFERDNYRAFAAFTWNKLFKAEIINPKNDSVCKIRHNEGIKVYSDVLFFVECVINSEKIIYFEDSYYHYFQRDTSLVHIKDIEKRKGSLLSYSKIITILKENSIDDSVIDWVKRFYAYHASLLAKIAIENKDLKNLRLMQNEMKKYLKEYKEKNKEYPERIKEVNHLINYNL